MQEEKNCSARISNWNVHFKLSSWLPSAIVRFFAMFHPAGTVLWVQQAGCCHDLHPIRPKALHRVPGMDTIPWTNFMIRTPLTSGRYTSDEFGSSYSKWSLASFVPSLPFHPPPLLPPAITLWVCLHHILQTAMSKLCPRCNLTGAMWLHWHQAWVNNPSWEGVFALNSTSTMSVHLSLQHQHAQKTDLCCKSLHSSGIFSFLPSFFLFPMPYKGPCTCIHNPSSQKNAPECYREFLSSLGAGPFSTAQSWILSFLLYQFKEVFPPKELTKWSHLIAHVPPFPSTAALLSFAFCPSTTKAHWWWPPCTRLCPLFAATPTTFPGYLFLQLWLSKSWQSIPWGLSAAPHPCPALWGRQTCEQHHGWASRAGREQPQPGGGCEKVSHNFHLLKFISSAVGSSWMLHIFKQFKAT